MIIAYSVAVIVIFTYVYLLNYSASRGNILANGREIGGDFVSFYVAGKLALSNPSQLYDFAAQLREQQLLFVNTDVHLGLLPFAYPPLVALFFSTFSSFSLLDAYLLWLFFSVTMFWASLYLLLNNLKIGGLEKLFLLIVLTSFVPFLLDCLGSGQTSCLGLAIFTGVFLAMSRQHDFTAGLILGLGYYKPPLFLFFALAMIAEQRWRVLSGAITSGAALLALTLLWFGADNFWAYLSVASSYTYGSQLLPGVGLPTSRGVGIYALANEFLGNGSKWAKIIQVCALLLALFLLHRAHPRRRSIALEDRMLLYAAQVTLSLFLSLQMISYDLTILAVPFALVYASTRFRNWRVEMFALAVGAFGLFAEWLLRFPDSMFSCARFFFCLWSISVTYLLFSHRLNNTSRE